MIKRRKSKLLGREEKQFKLHKTKLSQALKLTMSSLMKNILITSVWSKDIARNFWKWRENIPVKHSLSKNQSLNSLFPKLLPLLILSRKRLAQKKILLITWAYSISKSKLGWLWSPLAFINIPFLCLSFRYSIKSVWWKEMRKIHL